MEGVKKKTSSSTIIIIQKRSINIPLKVFYPLLTQSFFEHYYNFYIKISYCWKSKDRKVIALNLVLEI